MSSSNYFPIKIIFKLFRITSLNVLVIEIAPFLLKLRRSLLYTVAHNCHIKTKCSHQIQITHIKFKSLTANSNHSQQIQITHSKLKITHSKFKLLTANYKSTTANYKSFTSNTNRSHQIQIAHSK